VRSAAHLPASQRHWALDLKIKSEVTALLWALLARRSLLTSVALAQEVGAGRPARRSFSAGRNLQL